MIKKLAILAALSLAVMFPGAGAQAMTYSWDFNSGLDTANFTFVPTPGSGFTLDTSGQDLYISKPAGNGSDPYSGVLAGEVGSKFWVQGNFDMQVDYKLESTFNNKDWIQLNIIHDANQVLALGRCNSNGDNYHVWTNAYGEQGNTATSDTSGMFRLQRTGIIVAAYIGTTLLWTDPTYGADDVYVMLNVLQNNGSSYGPVAGSFDNLSITADSFRDYTPVPVPPTVLLLGSGLLGLAGWRLRKR